MIEFKNIDLIFGEQKICKNLNLQINKGEHLCFVGGSGKGKSSLLKMIMGILLPSSGCIYVNKTELTVETCLQIRNQISWLPQNVNLPVENSAELQSLLCLQPDEVKRYHDYLQALEISPQSEKKSFQELSGGQKQRILLAICLCQKKDIFLLDEPSSALDEHSIDLLLQLICRIKNKTIISVSHTPQWIAACSQTYGL